MDSQGLVQHVSSFPSLLRNAQPEQLPSPYRDLIERGITPLELPAEPDFDAVLKKLESGGTGTVSSWSRVGDVTRIWRRHPPKER